MQNNRLSLTKTKHGMDPTIPLEISYDGLGRMCGQSVLGLPFFIDDIVWYIEIQNWTRKTTKYWLFNVKAIQCAISELIFNGWYVFVAANYKKKLHMKLQKVYFCSREGEWRGRRVEKRGWIKSLKKIVLKKFCIFRNPCRFFEGLLKNQKQMKASKLLRFTTFLFTAFILKGKVWCSSIISRNLVDHIRWVKVHVGLKRFFFRIFRYFSENI